MNIKNRFPTFCSKFSVDLEKITKRKNYRLTIECIYGDYLTIFDAKYSGKH